MNLKFGPFFSSSQIPISKENNSKKSENIFKHFLSLIYKEKKVTKEILQDMAANIMKKRQNMLQMLTESMHQFNNQTMADK